MRAAAREDGRLPKRTIGSPSLESSTLARAVEQNSKEAWRAARSFSLPSVSASLDSEAELPEIFEHRRLLDWAMCMTRCAKVFISGVGLKLYLSAGMEFAAATIVLA